jgi:hypothetical protein
VAWAYAKDEEKASSGDGMTTVFGERQWRGSYRGVDMALWSQMTTQRFPYLGNPYLSNPAGICEVGIVLVTDQRAVGDGDPKQIGGVDELIFLCEHRYQPDEVRLFELVSDPSVRPVYVQNIEWEAIDVTVHDMGGGILGYTMNADPSGRVRTFDLEKALSQYDLAGPKVIEGADRYPSP